MSGKPLLPAAPHLSRDGSWRYGISSTSFLMASIESLTCLFFQSAFMISCMSLCQVHSCRFCRVKAAPQTSSPAVISTGFRIRSPRNSSGSFRTSPQPRRPVSGGAVRYFVFLPLGQRLVQHLLILMRCSNICTVTKP